MKFYFIDNGTDISRSVESAVSIGCSKERVASARDALKQLDNKDSVFSWRRIRNEGLVPKYEQMFTLPPHSSTSIFEIYQCLRSLMGAYICQKGEQPKLCISPEDPNIIQLINFDNNYNELLSRRYRISCCLGKKAESSKIKIINKPGADKQGSLTVSHIQYNPSIERRILQDASTGILKSKGPNHFQGFLSACIDDTTSLTPGATNTYTSCRRVRRIIRAVIKDLLNDTFVKEYAKYIQ